MEKKRDAKRSLPKRRTRMYRRHRSSAPKEKRFVRSTSLRVFSKDVQLVPGRTTKIVGGNRLYWHIYHLGKRAGHVSIDCFSREGNGKDTSIDVQLNQRSRGRGIGTVAFRRSCEMSGLPEVLASIRKGNVASRIAAERAGFVPLANQPGEELIMIWRRL